MPTFDQNGQEANETVVPCDVRVASIVVRHDEVLFRDGDGNVVVLVDRPRHPGAGLGLERAEPQ